MSATTRSSAALFEALRGRRTIYSLDATSTVPDSKLEAIVATALRTVPSAFNSQSTRAVLLVKDEHRRFWAMAGEELKKMLEASGEPERAERMKGRIDGFGKAYGSILMFESTKAWKVWQDKSPQYAHLFPEWAEHTSGMHQLTLWTALESEGMGANLQHYQFHRDVEIKAKDMYDLPDDWEMKAQIVFGGWDGQRPPEKEKLPSSESMRSFGTSST